VFHVEKEETLGEIVYDIGNGQWDIPALRSLLEDVLPDNNIFNDFVVDHVFPTLGSRKMLLNARRIDHVQLVLLAFEDITERMRAAAELTASESRFRALFEQTSAGVSEIDQSSGRLISANETLCRMHGKTASELVGMTMSELTHADDYQAVGPIFQRVLRGEVTSAQVDTRLLRNDGSYLWVHEALNLIRDERGRPIRAMGIAIDITDRKDAEAAMYEALKAKDEFLGLISHELRTPLTVIQGYAALLSKAHPLDQQTQTEAFQDILTESGRLARIIENMLYLARLDVGKEPEFEPVSIRHVFQEHVMDFAQRRPEAKVLLAEIDSDTVVTGNAGYIHQILELA
jgi:PAS domain S-box-containing protein